MKENYVGSYERVLKDLNTSVEGLSSEEASKRLAENGENVLPQKKQESKFVKFLKQFADVMIIILLVAAVISIAVAIVEKSTSEIIDGAVIMAIVLINAVMGYVQEEKAEKAMKALLKISETESKVYRDGEIKKIPENEIVVGDIILLEAGDIIPADVRFIETVNTECNESSLTGESLSTQKNAKADLSSETALADRCNSGYKGSVITAGRAKAVVVATGKDTELGKISIMLQDTKKQLTPLQKNIKTVGKVITILVLFVAGITFLLELTTRSHPNIIEAFLTAVAISVAAIPESLPAVITIIMSFGVAKLSQKRAIIKRLHAVETLGSTQIICSDKTGTLTLNKMTVTKVYSNSTMQDADSVDVTGNEELLNCMVLCNDSNYTRLGYVGDPTETALCNMAWNKKIDKVDVDQKFPRVKELSFDSIRKSMTTMHKTDDGYTLYVKGAIDRILGLSTKILINGEVVKLTDDMRKEIGVANQEMCDNALRVLAFAVKKEPKVADLENYQIVEQDLTFIGLVGMIDPPRPEVKSAVETCKRAGMTPIMITGDHANTAFAIAKELGIAQFRNQVLEGAMLDKLSDEEFLKVIDSIKVYARVSPENKVRIVQTFQSLGKVVAMTGDGVNDAPSLKQANIGVGMGITGTDVTKEVADVLITDDNFATIVVAVEEGRKIYSNIKKTVTFLFSANMAELLALLLCTILFPQHTFLLPVQILFVNLLTDCLPAIALGLEPAEDNLMRRPPRDSKKTIFADGSAHQIIFMGMIQTALILSSFLIGLQFSPVVATTMAFVCLNFVQLFYLVSIRFRGSMFSKKMFKNKWLWLSILIGVVLTVLIVATPVNTYLGLTGLNLAQWLLSILISLLVIPFSEILKVVCIRD